MIKPIFIYFFPSAFSAHGSGDQRKVAFCRKGNVFASLAYASGNFDLAVKMAYMATAVKCRQVDSLMG